MIDNTKVHETVSNTETYNANDYDGKPKRNKFAVTPHKVFTANELRKLVPSFKEEAVTSDNPKIINIIKDMFWRLGCQVEGTRDFHWVDVQEGIITRNRFKEIDTSTRYVLKERVDEEWLNSGCASSEAKAFTEDFTLHMELVKMKCGEFSLSENSKDIEV